MARRVDPPNVWGGSTDHSHEIIELRDRANESNDEDFQLTLLLAADLLEAHDQTGISLDDWPTARRFVERQIGRDIIPNLV